MIEKYEFTDKVLSVFKLVKNETYKQGGDFSLPVYEDGKQIAVLHPLTKRNLIDNEENRKLIELLAQWREASSRWFDVFKVTEEGTRIWLKKQVIDMKNRLLFMLETVDGIPIGHMGFYRGEVDNVIRGRRDILKGVMTHALNAMLKWAFTDLDIRDLYVRVFSDNERAIAFYKRCGFSEIGKIPLRKVEKEESIRWEPIETGDRGKPDRFFSLMHLRSPNIKGARINCG